jgi:hypothetical protein
MNKLTHCVHHHDSPKGLGNDPLIIHPLNHKPLQKRQLLHEQPPNDPVLQQLYGIQSIPVCCSVAEYFVGVW